MQNGMGGGGFSSKSSFTPKHDGGQSKFYFYKRVGTQKVLRWSLLLRSLEVLAMMKGRRKKASTL